MKTAKTTENAVLLDVRTAEEFAAGHVPGSVNLPLDVIATIAIPTSAPLFVYCHSGARSARACEILIQRGYTVTNIGGIVEYSGTTERGGI
ncbi:MAG: rhodanese-like domain-containing protein [Clostridia bacterium]